MVEPLPGRRFDSEGYIYQYLFSEELYKGWSWSEKFPGQPEIERWLQYVTETLDLRRDIQFSTRITSATTTRTASAGRSAPTGGDVIDTQFFVSCGGMLSAPVTNQFEGAGLVRRAADLHLLLSRRSVDVAGKRVGGDRDRGHRDPGDPDHRPRRSGT